MRFPVKLHSSNASTRARTEARARLVGFSFHPDPVHHRPGLGRRRGQTRIVARHLLAARRLVVLHSLRDRRNAFEPQDAIRGRAVRMGETRLQRSHGISRRLESVALCNGAHVGGRGAGRNESFVCDRCRVDCRKQMVDRSGKPDYSRRTRRAVDHRTRRGKMAAQRRWIHHGVDSCGDDRACLPSRGREARNR